MAMEKVLACVGEMRPKTKIVCTLGPASRFVEMAEKLLRAGINVACFNFSRGSHGYHQETLDNLRTAMNNTGILCVVMLDSLQSAMQLKRGIVLFIGVLCLFSAQAASELLMLSPQKRLCSLLFNTQRLKDFASVALHRMMNTDVFNILPVM